MQAIQSGDVRYYCFETLSSYNVPHAVITRHGGVSPFPWATLNLGATVGDDLERVKENRRKAFEAVGRDIHAYYDVWQVHSNRVICTHTPRNPEQPHEKADAILTNTPGLTLFMRFADCVPVLLFDPVKKAIGVVHAGWMGTIKQIVALTVEKMISEYNSSPGDIVAAIGPSICQKHYEVGKEVVNEAYISFQSDADIFIRNENGHYLFNLWEANKYLLEKAGVEHIEVSGICTACHLEEWFSHRGEAGKTGRFGVMIGL
ncbi:MAG: peptidoglycan editing factor PgeF [Chloroflexi bacterium]|nr:peptidoglycan editing factor PgeF [Chloroflexota bacterium]